MYIMRYFDRAVWLLVVPLAFWATSESRALVPNTMMVANGFKIPAVVGVATWRMAWVPIAAI